MAQLVVRNLDEDVKERLRARAKRSGRSLEAEVRVILQRASYEYGSGLDARDMDRALSSGDPEFGLGSEIISLFRGNGLSAEDLARIEALRHPWRGRVPEHAEVQPGPESDAQAEAHLQRLDAEIQAILAETGAVSAAREQGRGGGFGTAFASLFSKSPAEPGEIEELRGGFARPVSFDE